MNIKRAPAALPAAVFVAGLLLARTLVHLSIAPLAALIALGIAWGGRGGALLAWTAAGLLAATAAGQGPERDRALADPARPVAALVRVSAHAQGGAGEEMVAVRVEALRQGRRVVAPSLEALVTLPEGCPAPPLGTRLRLRGYLRRSWGYRNFQPPRPGPWRLRLKSCRLLEVEAKAPAVGELAHRLRGGVAEVFERQGEGPGTALARALLLADRSRLPDRWQQGLRRAGLGHLLAVSGLHLAVLAAVAAFLAAPLGTRWGRPARLLPPALAVVAYLLLAGSSPSLLRASIMALLTLAALAAKRPPAGVNALGCALVALLALDPAMLSRLGLSLSAAATASILLFAPTLEERWRRSAGFRGLAGPLRRPLAAALAAQLATLPLLAPRMGGLTPLAPLLDLVAIPWLALFLLAAFLWLGVATCSTALGGAATTLLDVLSAPVEGLSRLPAGPALFLPLELSNAEALVLACALGAALLLPAAGRRWLLALPLLALWGGGPRASDPELLMLDVGQGDAILLRDGQRTLLLDGGGWPRGDFGGRVLVPALAAAGIRRLDAVVLSHPDRDHCGGLLDLLRYLPAEELWMGTGWEGEPCAEELLAVPGPRWRPLWAGAELARGRWRLRVLHPAAGERFGGNDGSLVLRAEAHGLRVLLAGDIEAAAERRILRRGEALEAEVLKVAHHGSKSSSTPPFLAAVGPRLALVSAGRRNPYGHPSRRVLERLEGRGIRVLRSDLHGLVRLRLVRPPGGGTAGLRLEPRR